MLKAGVFEDFKGATTLLLWGDREGMTTLLDSLSALENGNCNRLAMDGPRAGLTICFASNEAEGSTLRMEEGGFRWHCSPETIALATDLVEPLLTRPGHQFLDVDGLADQVVISRDEYPVDLR